MDRQIALVTGSSRGIGLATAVSLAHQGFAIVLNSPVADAELKAAGDQIRAIGVPVFEAAFDVTLIAEYDRLFDEIEATLGPLTTLVNNAGVGVKSRGDLLDVTVESYDNCFAVNTRSVFFLSQAFCRRLLEHERLESMFYSIINVTSSNAVAVAVQRAEYTASKAAAAMISRAFAVRLGSENIAVYDVQPGLINTDMTAPVIESYAQRAKDGLTLLPRIGQPADVGEAIATLATGKIPYSTGQVISVDGGMLVPRF